jgi:septum site-determining protein MinD
MAEDTSKIITFFSSKGGVGKTLLSTNTALALHAKTGLPTILVDFDLGYGGDMAKMMNMLVGKYVSDMITNMIKAPNTALNIKDYIVKHDCGVYLLQAIPNPRHAHLINPDYIDAVFTLLRKEFAYIVVDAGRNFNEPLISIFDNSNLIIIVLTSEVLSLYQTKWNVEALESLHFPVKMVKVLLNRAESKGAVQTQEIRAFLPSEIIGYVPSEGRVVGPAVNQGVPFILSNPRSKIGQAIVGLAETLASKSDIYMPKQRLARQKLTEEALEKTTFWDVHGLAVKQDLETLSRADEIVELKRKIHNQLVEELNLKRLDLVALASDPQKAEELKLKTQRIISNILGEQGGGLISSYEVRNLLVKEITDEALGLGPLEDLLKDPTVSEIMVNNKDQIYIERHGKLELSAKKFISNEQIKLVMERIVAPLGRRIDESVPMVDARLPDGSRVNCIIPPLSTKGPMITIRKFAKERYDMPDMIKFNTLTEEMADFLRACVVARKNVVISGGTGSGKTTLLNALSQYIPETERIITIEDAVELKLFQEHWASLEARMPNIEGKGEVTVRDLFRNSLRMRPDRIIVGECRGHEALDMLQAMNTGHDGSMTTIHANSTHDVITRLDSMVLMSNVELPIRAIREQIASAIHLIIQTARLSDGSRKVTQISEITGLEENINITFEDIYVFEQMGVDEEAKILGEYRFTGHIPTFIDDFRVRNIPIPPSIHEAMKAKGIA